MYAVFDLGKTPKAQVDQVLGNPTDPRADLVSRQSISFREGKTLGFPDLGNLLLVEGTEAAVAKAVELFGPLGKRLDAGPAEAVVRAVRAEEDEAASGMGLIFG